MNKESFKSNRLYGLLPTDSEGMEALTELALDLRWSCRENRCEAPDEKKAKILIYD